MVHFLRLAAAAFMIVVLAGVALAMLMSFGLAVRKAIKKDFWEAL